MTVGEPCQGSGELFFGAGFPNTGISYIMVSRGNLDQAGGTFFRGRISEHWDFLYNGGGTWPGPGELFFPGTSYLTLTKARTPTARRC